MPELGLGIGYERGDYGGVTREWLYWYDENNQRYPTPTEWVKQEQQRTQLEIDKTRQAQAESERAQAESKRAQAESEQARELVARLAAKLRDLGIDPDEV